MRFLILALLFCSSANAASFSSTVFYSTDYIFRGVTYSNHTPVLQGSLDFAHEGFGFGLFGGPVYSFNTTEYIMEPDYEFDTFLNYTKSIEELNITGGFNFYQYFNNYDNSLLEFMGRLNYESFKLNLSYIHDFVHLGTNFSYDQLVWTPMISDEVMMTSHIAYAWFGNPDALATTNCFDYKIGLAYLKGPWYAELYYTNTIGRRDTIANTEYNDANMAFTVAHTFAFAP